MSRDIPLMPAYVNSAQEARVQSLFDENYLRVAQRTDRMFVVLMLTTWVASIGFAYFLSPLAWAGKVSAIHGHVYAAIFLGGAITSFPVAMAFARPGTRSTRYAIACGQVLWSALLIHLTGGRIETHFHIFGSLAIIAFYRDLRVLVPATLIVAADHFIRGIYWPESVYGVVNPEWWRFLEHVGWVVFIDVFLIINCLQSYRELWALSARQAEIQDSQQKVVLVERLAAVGKLATNIGRRIERPLELMETSHRDLEILLRKKGAMDAEVQALLERSRNEIEVSTGIVSNLIGFSGAAPAELRRCPLRPLVEEALGAVKIPNHVEVKNDVPEDLPIPALDAGQMRQVLANIIQNGIEAIPRDRKGRITVWARGGGAVPWMICVEDNGDGIADEDREHIFEPLFTTKPQGTGLGLSVVNAVLENHHADISIEPRKNDGTKVNIILPPNKAAAAAE